MRGVNDTMVTINAAASAIQSAENRGGQSSSVQKKRWGSCWNISLCFGSQKQSKRIGHAELIPEPNSSRTEPSTTTHMSQPPSIVLPFIAPPSSPASFLQSEPPSAAHSPGGFLSFTSISASMYSPGGPANMFAIGPYAHETQLVSPPVFSTYTTEPSTAPFTPPPESVHLTTPSSPEVPYARLLGASNGNDVIPYEFQSYQLYPGSPMGEYAHGGNHHHHHFRHFPASGKVSPYDSGTLTPPDGGVGPTARDGFLVTNVGPDQHLVDHRVSFEVTPEEVVRCVKRRRAAAAHVAYGRKNDDMAYGRIDDVAKGYECWNGGETYGNNNRSITSFGSVKEFNFDSTDGTESDWWASEKIIGKENGPIKDWSFFPMMQPGVS